LFQEVQAVGVCLDLTGALRAIEEVRVELEAFGLHVADDDGGRVLHQFPETPGPKPVQLPVGQARYLAAGLERLLQWLAIEVQVAILGLDHVEGRLHEGRVHVEHPVSEVKHGCLRRLVGHLSPLQQRL